MVGEWQTDVPQVTAKEADQLIELWLRERLRPQEGSMSEPSVFSVKDIAQALGAREEEVSKLLSNMRAKAAPVQARKAIPVKLSMRLIAAIYVSFAVLAISIFASIHHRNYEEYRYNYVPDGAAPWAVQRSSTPRELILPHGFSLEYENRAMVGRSEFADGRSSRNIDWKTGEAAILANINHIDAGETRTYRPDIAAKDISQALSAVPRVRLDSPGVVDADAGTDNIVAWHKVSVTVNGSIIETALPTATVLNEDLDKAVGLEVRKRVSGLLKALKAKLSPAAPAESAPSV